MYYCYGEETDIAALLIVNEHTNSEKNTEIICWNVNAYILGRDI